MDVGLEPQGSWLTIQLLLGAQSGDRKFHLDVGTAKLNNLYTMRFGGNWRKDWRISYPHSSVRTFMVFVKVLGAIIEELSGGSFPKGGQVLKRCGKVTYKVRLSPNPTQPKPSFENSNDAHLKMSPPALSVVSSSLETLFHVFPRGSIKSTLKTIVHLTGYNAGCNSSQRKVTDFLTHFRQHASRDNFIKTIPGKIFGMA